MKKLILMLPNYVLQNLLELELECVNVIMLLVFLSVGKKQWRLIYNAYVEFDIVMRTIVKIYLDTSIFTKDEMIEHVTDLIDNVTEDLKMKVAYID